jgi:enoyl-CoA hydratase
MIERSDRGPVTLLSISHGPVNAMDIELVRTVTDTFAELAADPPGAVVLTGTGRAFSAGVDLHGFLAGGADWVAEFLPALSELFGTVFAFPGPVVAAVNGYAIAGGAVLACCADTRLMAAGRGRIGVPEAAVGVAFPRVVLEVLIHTVGAREAGRLVRGASTLLPEQALALGLVDEVVAAETLVDRAVEVATGLATSIPVDTYALTKRQLRRDALDRATRYGTDEAHEVARIWTLRSQDGWTKRYLDSVTGKG